MRKQRYFNEQDRFALFRIIQEKTDYPLHSNSLLSQAFRRSSFCVANGGKSNEMFEFNGDQILSYYTVKIIAQRLGGMNFEGDYALRSQPSQFSAWKQKLLSNENFAKIIDDWGVADYLIVGKDDEKSEVHKQMKIKADLFEAIIGAIAEDCKWDAEILEKVVGKVLGLEEQIADIIECDPRRILFDMENAVTKLKELVEQGQCSRLSYDFMGPECLGYDKDGDPIWTCTCRVVNDVTGITTLVRASSKKNAKKAAAYLALCEHFQMPNQYGLTGFEKVMCKPWVYKNGKLKPKNLG